MSPSSSAVRVTLTKRCAVVAQHEGPLRVRRDALEAGVDLEARPAGLTVDAELVAARPAGTRAVDVGVGRGDGRDGEGREEQRTAPVRAVMRVLVFMGISWWSGLVRIGGSAGADGRRADDAVLGGGRGDVTAGALGDVRVDVGSASSSVVRVPSTSTSSPCSMRDSHVCPGSLAWTSKDTSVVVVLALGLEGVRRRVARAGLADLVVIGLPPHEAAHDGDDDEGHDGGDDDPGAVHCTLLRSV